MHARNPTRIYTYMEGGAKDCIDVITEHPYRNCPELPDYAADLVSIKRIGEKELRDIFVPRAQKPIKLDGEFSDWPADSQNITLTFKDATPSDLTKSWTSEEREIKVELHLAWSESALYMTIVVFKKSFNSERRFGMESV